MTAAIRTPIVLLTGFLGSGKTTLLARWVKTPPFDQAAAIVNELGEIGLDHRLVTSAIDVPVAIAGGCVCCEAGGDLNATIENLYDLRLTRQVPNFTAVLVETSGIADPLPILARLNESGIARERFDFKGVAATFDAIIGPEMCANHPECRSQIASAGVVIVTKTDVANTDQLAAARAAIAAHAPGVTVLESSRGGLAPAAVMAALEESGAPGAGSRFAVHTPGVSSTFVAFDRAVDRARADAALARLPREVVLRVKGVLSVIGEPRPQILQLTPGGAASWSDDTAPHPARLGLTVIARDGRAAALARELAIALDLAADPT